MDAFVSAIYIYLQRNMKHASVRMNRKSGNDKKCVCHDIKIKALFSEEKYPSGSCKINLTYEIFCA